MDYGENSNASCCSDYEKRFDFSYDFQYNRRLYFKKPESVLKLMEALGNYYTYIIEIDEFDNISVVPVHKEYDEVNIVIEPIE